MLKISLLNHTSNGFSTVWGAVSKCYNSQIEEREQQEQIVAKCIKSGHTSVLEHISFTFEIEEVSRTLSHQLVRHRIASYSQQSQRYVDQVDNKCIIPESIEREMGRNTLVNKSVKKLIEDYECLYQDLTLLGVPKEDARYLLPQGTETTLVVTMNGRALYNFFALRCCKRSQWEIRELAKGMLEICKRKEPFLFSFAGTTCESCKEANKCK